MTPLSDTYLEARRQEILDAAARVFIEKGYAAATVSDIASEAGVATGSIYRYFASKADLIAAVAGDCVDEYMEQWQEHADGIPSAGEALLRLGEMTRDEYSQEGHRDISTLRLESFLAARRDVDLQRRITPSMDHSIEALAGFIERAQTAGEFDETWNARDFAQFLHALGAGIGAMSVVYGESFETSRAWDLLIRLVAQCFRGEVAALAAAKGAR